MAHIPKEEVTMVWNQTPERNWSSLNQSVMDNRGEGIEDEIAEAMMAASQNLEEAGQPYPNSRDELYKVIDEQITTVDERI
jgi:hypothetical protein